MAGPGVRSQDGRKIGKKSLLFYLFIFIYRDSEERLTSKVRSGEARFGPELDGEKLSLLFYLFISL